MKNELTTSGYVEDPVSKVWGRPEYRGISYNDGDEVETRIEKIISSASDRSVLSTELQKHCTDWPSYYHLNSCRANILRPFEDTLKGASVLEIGAGCGAITRYLGEAGAITLALEGSPRRARIARQRSASLENVTVVADNFDSFHTDQKFDFVTMIGVLEYAPVFIPGESPVSEMLQRAKHFLKPGGRLIIAIENKLGLKYFAGAPEDHHGRPMYGLEERYLPSQPTTFGKKELLDVLTSSGFPHISFLAPFPDYKVPSTIITEGGFSTTSFDVAPLIQHSIEKDKQLPVNRVFSLHAVWQSVAKNKLALDLSNSFLVVASAQSPSTEFGDILAFHYNTNRRPPFCKKTIFSINANGAIAVSCSKLLPESSSTPGEAISLSLHTTTPYYSGVPASADLFKIISSKGWRVETLGEFIRTYIYQAVAFKGIDLTSPGAYHPDTVIPGDLYDALPSNLIKTQSGDWQQFDLEWHLNKPFSIGWLIFRALLPCLYSREFSQESGSDFEKTHIGFMRSAFQAAGLSVSEEQLLTYGQLESEVQSEISGTRVPPDFWQGSREFSPITSIYDEAARLLKLLRNAESELVDTHKVLLMKSNQLDLQRDISEQLVNSLSWRLTRPLRSLRSLFRQRHQTTKKQA